MKLKCLIIGATSAIAQAVAKRYAERGACLYLAGRDVARLEMIAQDLKVRYNVEVYCQALDVSQTEGYDTFLETVCQKFSTIDVAILAHGSLSNQKACEQSVAMTLAEFNINALSYIELLTLLANRMELQQSGSLVAIGSCAGDRGRQSNYVYGAAKAAVHAFMQGLRNRLHSKGIHVLTVKPGFVDTPMTAEFKKGLLWAQPDDVARLIIKAIDRKRNVIYTPTFWWGIMTIVKLVPERIFKTLKM